MWYTEYEISMSIVPALYALGLITDVHREEIRTTFDPYKNTARIWLAELSAEEEEEEGD